MAGYYIAGIYREKASDTQSDRPEFTRADLSIAVPKVIAGQVDMCPVQRQQLLQQHDA